MKHSVYVHSSMCALFERHGVLTYVAYLKSFLGRLVPSSETRKVSNEDV